MWALAESETGRLMASFHTLKRQVEIINSIQIFWPIDILMKKSSTNLSSTGAPESKDNHFIAQFHLAYWCGADGKLTIYSRPHGKVVTLGRSRRSTGFEPNLYAYELISPEKRHSIEDDFFKHLDTRAAPVVQKY
jgi:hypothetical protein